MKNNKFEKLTVLKLSKYILQENNNWIYAILLVILSAFSYIKIIQIPKLIANYKSVPMLLYKFSILYGIYTMSSIIYRKLSLDFESIIQTFSLKTFLSKLLKKQEEESKGLIPNSVTSDAVSVIYGMGNIISSICDNFPILISTVFVFIFIIKNFGIGLGSIFLLNLSIQAFIISKFSKKLIETSQETNNHKKFILDEAQDLNINIDSILNSDQIENESKYIVELSKIYHQKINKSFSNRFKIQNYSIIINYIYLIFSLFYISKFFSTKLVIEYIFIGLSLNQAFISKIDQFVLILFFYGKLVDSINNVNEYSTYEKNEKKDTNTKLRNNKSLSVERLKFSYNNNFKIDLEINELIFESNKINILKGNIGSGKTTLLKILFGLVDINSGIIKYNDLILDNKREWRKQVHYTPQRPELFNKSIEENIFYPKKNGNSDDFQIIIDSGLFNIYKDITSRGNDLGLGGGKMSGGQKQIINLFRAILTKKDIILLDEPTSALDEKNRNIIYMMIKSMIKLNKTIIISTHDPELIKLGQKIIQLNKGKIEKITNK